MHKEHKTKLYAIYDGPNRHLKTDPDYIPVRLYAPVDIYVLIVLIFWTGG